MRFGIMAMQIDSLIPAEARLLPPDQAIARILGFDHSGLVRQLASQGFDPIELGGDLSMLLPHTYSAAAIEKLAEVKAELGLSFTLHLPLWSVEPSSLLLPIRQGSVQVLVDMIHLTQPLLPEVYVLHATGALAAEFYHMQIPEMARAILMRQFQSGARQSLQTILSETGLPSRKLAIETVEFPFDLTLQLADELDLSMCLDTGHVLAGFSGYIGLDEALERCLPRLANIHLHDCPWQGPQHNLGYGKDHQPLGKGDLDVAHFLGRLMAADYRGPIIFELRLDEALASMEVIKKLRPDALNTP